MSHSAFRSRSATELVDAAVQLARRHYAPLITLGALVAIPGVLVGVVAQLVMRGSEATAMTGALALLLFPLMLVSSCWTMVGFGAYVKAAAAAYLDGRALEPLVALRAALRHGWSLIAGNLVAGLIVGALVLVIMIVLMVVVAAIGGLLTAVARLQMGSGAAAAAGMVVGIAAMVVGAVAALLVWSQLINVTAVIVLEGLGPMDAIRRSRELVRGSARHTAAVLLLLVVLWLVVYGTTLLLATLLLQRFELASSMAGVLTVLLYPFFGCLLTLLYYDLRIRHEGYDLELMARALEQAPSGVPV
ncbi:MAG TPA: hypothetical protein VFS08_16625 [Gemmatimonadaceae bacterium]|nr:hypothetical protein [Gemmatimonadaceae bacterium]